MFTKEVKENIEVAKMRKVRGRLRDSGNEKQVARPVGTRVFRSEGQRSCSCAGRRVMDPHHRSEGNRNKGKERSEYLAIAKAALTQSEMSRRHEWTHRTRVG